MGHYLFLAIVFLTAPTYRDARDVLDAARAEQRVPRAEDLYQYVPPTFAEYADAIDNAITAEGTLMFQGERARERTALLLTAVAFNESSFANDVATCTAAVSKARPQDQGRSIGLTQLFRGPAWYGYTREQICDSVELQFRLALRFLVEGRRVCGTTAGALSYFNAGPVTQCRATMQSARTYTTFQRLVVTDQLWRRLAAKLPVLADSSHLGIDDSL